MTTFNPPGRPELELYSYEQLSRIWSRKVSTIRRWVSQARKAGVLIYGVYRLDAHHRRREFYLRGDSMLALHAWAFRIALTPYRPRGPRRVKAKRPRRSVSGSP